MSRKRKKRGRGITFQSQWKVDFRRIQTKSCWESQIQTSSGKVHVVKLFRDSKCNESRGWQQSQRLACQCLNSYAKSFRIATFWNLEGDAYWLHTVGLFCEFYSNGNGKEKGDGHGGYVFNQPATVKQGSSTKNSAPAIPDSKMNSWREQNCSWNTGSASNHTQESRARRGRKAYTSTNSCHSTVAARYIQWRLSVMSKSCMKRKWRIEGRQPLAKKQNQALFSSKFFLWVRWVA